MDTSYNSSLAVQIRSFVSYFLRKRAGLGGRMTANLTAKEQDLTLNLQIIPVPEVKSSEHQTGKDGQTTDDQEGVAEGIVDFILDQPHVSFKELEHNQAKSNPKTDCQLLIDRNQ